MFNQILRRVLDAVTALSATMAMALAVALAHGSQGDYDRYLRYRLPFALLGLVFLAGCFAWGNWREGFVIAGCLALAGFGPVFYRLLQAHGLWPQTDLAGWSVQYVVMILLIMLAMASSIPHWSDWQAAIILRWQIRGGMVEFDNSSDAQVTPQRHLRLVVNNDAQDGPTMVS